MKILLATAVLCATMATGNTTNSTLSFKNDKEKKEKKKKSEKTTSVRNFHSVNKWKITIDYKNGERISKTIVVKENSNKSALETAFSEAEKYLKKSKNIKDFSVTPVSGNSYVLLAGGN